MDLNSFEKRPIDIFVFDFFYILLCCLAHHTSRDAPCNNRAHSVLYDGESTRLLAQNIDSRVLNPTDRLVVLFIQVLSSMFTSSKACRFETPLLFCYSHDRQIHFLPFAFGHYRKHVETFLRNRMEKFIKNCDDVLLRSTSRIVPNSLIDQIRSISKRF